MSSIFTVSILDYETDFIDSIWTSEEAAIARAAEIDRALVSEYRANDPQGWVRCGWVPPKDPPLPSDWGAEPLPPSA